MRTAVGLLLLTSVFLWTPAGAEESPRSIPLIIDVPSTTEEPVPVTGGIALELLALDGQSMPRGRPSPAGRSPRRKPAKAKRRSDKTKRKVSRKRR